MEDDLGRDIEITLLSPPARQTTIIRRMVDCKMSDAMVSQQSPENPRKVKNHETHSPRDKSVINEHRCRRR